METEGKLMALVYRSDTQRACPQLNVDLAKCIITSVHSGRPSVARLVPGAALCFEWAHIAIALRGAVEPRAPVMNGAAGAEQLAVGADIVAMPLVPDEV